MIGLITSTVATLILPLIFFFFFNKWKISKNTKSMKVLPPGPKKLPIIGNLHQMRNPPFRCFRDLSNQHGPLMHLKIGERNAVIVSSAKMARKLLKDMDPSFTDRVQNEGSRIIWYNGSDIAFSHYGEYWRQMRKLCINDLLSPKMVRLFQTIREDESVRLVSLLHESCGSRVNFSEKLFYYTSSITCRAAFGSVCKDRDKLLKMMVDSLSLIGGFEVVDLFPSSRIIRALSWRKLRLMETMRRELDVILDDIIDQHKRNRAESGGRKRANSEFGGEDLVDVFLRAKEEEELKFPIDNNNIKAVLLDIFSAGTDTSASTIDWTMVELMRHPRVLAKVQAEVRQALDANMEGDHDLKYLNLVIKETLRLHPALPMLPRSCKKEHLVDGYTIPARSMVMINIWAIQRDPRAWKDPEVFNPERYESMENLNFVGGDFKYLPFGFGRRMCPGLTFGLANVEAALVKLLYNFDWKLPEGVKTEDLDMIENLGITASRKQHLFMVATPYK